MKMGAFLLGGLVAIATGLLGWFGGAAWTAAKLAKIDANAATLYVGYIGALVAVSAAIIAIWGVYSQRVITRRQTTIQHIAGLKSDRWVQDQIDKFIDLTKGQGNLAQYATAAYEGSDEQQAIHTVLNLYELLSNGVQHGIFEYQLIERWQKNTIMRYWNHVHPYVVALRQRVQIGSLWIEYEKLNDWVSGKKSPFFALWWTGFG